VVSVENRSSQGVHNRTDAGRVRLVLSKPRYERLIMSFAPAAASAASDRSAARPSRDVTHPDTTTAPATPSAIRPGGPGRQMLGWFEDGVLLLVLGLAFPLAILIVGTPIALAVRLLIEVGRRWY
jgi:hypothetical protein